MSNFIVIAIESTCDETAISLARFRDGEIDILSNEISSQVKLHAKWGGVVPNLAAREHVKNITPLLDISFQKSGITPEQIDFIAVTQGPGLIPALMVGNNFAKTLSYLWDKPLVGIHHIEGHIYANFVRENSKFEIRNSKKNEKKNSLIKNSETIFPVLALVVSGGHTQLVLMKDHFKYEIIGQTLDDAAGEAFDKVARILNVGYPGGPNVSKWAEKYSKEANNHDIVFPRPMLNKKTLDFSFSGLKTAVLYETKKNPENLKDENYLAAVCHEFQQSVIDVLVAKTMKAAEKYNPKTIMLAGGVSANKQLRKQLEQAIEEKFPEINYQIPDIYLTGDNAAMIATAAAYRWSLMSEAQRKKASSAWKTLAPEANLKLK